MPLEIRKQNKESSQSLIRRFSFGIQRSGILRRARQNRFRVRSKSRQMQRRSILRREGVKKREYERLKKTGKLE